MRPELEILKEIESYLNNKLSENEKKAFEDKLKLDVNLAKEVKLQRDIIEGIERIGVKKSISKAGIKYRRIKMVKFFAIGFTIIFSSISVYIYLNTTSEKISVNTNKTELPQFIKPAFDDVNIPFNQFVFNAEVGDTIFYETGSILVFPPNAFLDKNGKLITGEIKITYRELADPIDFFLSGIPMDYDSNGVKYTFESAGMMEMYGYQNDEPIFVNPQSKPEINLASKTTDDAHNLYYLDTVQRKWIGKGKDVISVIDEEQESEKTADMTRIESSKFDIPIPPFTLEKPNKASGKMPTFSIVIEPGSVPELHAYNQLLFEVDKDEKNYDASQSKTEWGDVIVEKATIKGKYLVTFIKGNKKLTYLTRPVFEGKNYDEALLLFESKKKEYNSLLTKRLGKEKKQKELAESRDKENEETYRLNILIEARNKEIERNNAKVNSYKIALEYKLKIQKLVNLIEIKSPEIQQYSQNEIKQAMILVEERQTKVKETLEKQREFQKKIAENTEKEKTQKEKKLDSLNFENGIFLMQDQVMRTFQLSGFGVWNSDNPIFIAGRNAISIKAHFYNENNVRLDLVPVYVVYKGFNGINWHHDALNDFTYPKLFVIPNANNMIWSVLENKLIYLSYDDFKKCDITPETKEYTFKMNVYPDKIKSKEDIKRILGL